MFEIGVLFLIVADTARERPEFRHGRLWPSITSIVWWLWGCPIGGHQVGLGFQSRRPWEVSMGPCHLCCTRLVREERQEVVFQIDWKTTCKPTVSKKRLQKQILFHVENKCLFIEHSIEESQGSQEIWQSFPALKLYAKKKKTTVFLVTKVK